jgi:carbamoyl-phosphate synthase large subunit
VPRRRDLRSVLLIGSGPIVIGQAAEFDYSGTQAVKALREEGIRVSLVNSNPATIMTDPELAPATYIEPLTVEVLEQIIAREKPDALLPTLGGQTALNLAVAAAKAGVLERHGVELIGASVEAIEKAEDRQLFKAAMQKIGLEVPRSFYVRSLTEGREAVRELGYPTLIRPSFTLGGSGAAIAFNADELDEKVAWGLSQSPRGEVLLEESVLGWKEYELEVMRDGKDNVVVICSIENFDPMGVHTGDSITVAPAMTLTDKEYQRMRDAAARVIREIGVATGGSNVQFAVDPKTGRMVVIEMNPRVSRSSALASKATGFPIAKIAAKLAIGYTLDEIPNDITRETPACFEPTIDYVVVKVPRFAFEKFAGADIRLGPQMKSVGEVMAIGRTFRESLNKAIRSLESGRFGFDLPLGDDDDLDRLRRRVSIPTADRLLELGRAFQLGLTVTEAHQLTAIDPWFLVQLRSLAMTEEEIRGRALADVVPDLPHLKRLGMADRRIATLTGSTEDDVRKARLAAGLRPVYKRVDTCAAEFEARTPYLYSTYESECEAQPTDRRKVLILGGGPNRIGQGIEFDYCCVHAVMALREDGFETIMVNCNPETVSTDYDTADRLYFEPLTREDVLGIIDREQPEGVIVQFGGQTPLKLAVPLAKAGVKILGTSADAIDRAEDRERFGELIHKLDLRAPAWGVARTPEEVFAVAARIGYPVMVRPSYVLGGRAMEAVYDERQLRDYLVRHSVARGDTSEHPVILVDQFLRDAVEVDIDCVADATGDVIVGGIMEHIEEAGIHSGDSACALPPYSLSPPTVETIKSQARNIARELGVVGLMNAQFAVQDGVVYILEVNPRASRTVPFVSKATGVALAKIAARVMCGKTLAELGAVEPSITHVAVKESVFPFVKFPGVDTILGPEMRSTGEVMGIDLTFAVAFAKSQRAAGNSLPDGGAAFLSVREADKVGLLPLARRLVTLGFSLIATRGTAAFLERAGLPVRPINKVRDGQPHCVDAMVNGEVSMVVNTTEGAQEIQDSFSLRRTALLKGLSYFTTIRAAQAAVDGIAASREGPAAVRSLQEYHGEPTVRLQVPLASPDRL